VEEKPLKYEEVILIIYKNIFHFVYGCREAGENANGMEEQKELHCWLQLPQAANSPATETGEQQ
jgi:hypothetical protein